MRRAHLLAARGLKAVGSRERRVLVCADALRTREVFRPLFASGLFEGPRVLAEPDIQRFWSQLKRPNVEFAVVLGSGPCWDALGWDGVMATARHTADRLPLVVLECPPEDLGGAFETGADLVVPQQAETAACCGVLNDALLLRRLMRRRCNGPTGQVEEPTSQRRVLVVDDEPSVRDVVTRALSLDGLTVDGAEDGIDGIRRVLKEPDAYDVLLINYLMPRMDGLDLLLLLSMRSDFDTPCALYSGALDKPIPFEAARLGAWAWWWTPFTIEHLRRVVQKGLALKAARALA